MGKEITKKFGICDKKAMRAKAKEIMERMGVSIPYKEEVIKALEEP